MLISTHKFHAWFLRHYIITYRSEPGVCSKIFPTFLALEKCSGVEKLSSPMLKFFQSQPQNILGLSARTKIVLMFWAIQLTIEIQSKANLAYRRGLLSLWEVPMWFLNLTGGLPTCLCHCSERFPSSLDVVTQVQEKYDATLTNIWTSCGKQVWYAVGLITEGLYIVSLGWELVALAVSHPDYFVLWIFRD